MRAAAVLCRKRFFQMLLFKPRQRAKIDEWAVSRLKCVVQLFRPAERGAGFRCKRTAQRGGAADFLSLCVGKLRRRVEPEVPRGLAVKAEIAGHRDERQSILRQDRSRQPAAEPRP